jgi:hypothetical protein
MLSCHFCVARVMTISKPFSNVNPGQRYWPDGELPYVRHHTREEHPRLEALRLSYVVVITCNVSEVRRGVTVRLRTVGFMGSREAGHRSKSSQPWGHESALLVFSTDILMTIKPRTA